MGFASQRTHVKLCLQACMCIMCHPRMHTCVYDNDRRMRTHAGAPRHANREIASRPVCQGARLHFVDDRLETLKAAQQAGLGGSWSLYLADWWALAGGGACVSVVSTCDHVVRTPAHDVPFMAARLP